MSHTTVRTQTLIGIAAQALALGGGVLIGAKVAIALVIVGVLALLLAAMGTATVQRCIPALGHVPLVFDHDLEVVSRDQLERLERDAQMAGQEAAGAKEPEGLVTFAEIKTRIEGYIKEGRALYAALENGPTPAQVGDVYDQTREWQDRVASDLERYHGQLAYEFEQGGYILSPSLAGTQPTDAKTLKVIIRRRGFVLRNVLDGTPGKDVHRTTA